MYKLQNGTDIRGIACENEHKEVNLTVDKVKEISKAFYIWLKKNNKKSSLKIAIGSDSRITGDLFRSSSIECLVEHGCNVIDCGLASTPSMFMTTIMNEYECDGAIMITASHLPYYYNGMKFFTPKGGLEKEDISEILNIAISNKTLDINKKGHKISKDLLSDYSNILVENIRKGANSAKDYNRPLNGLKIIIDAGNGAGGFFESKVLKELGACTDGSQFLEPDGMFPNHIPNPENKEAMESISQAVLKYKSDLGIIFDTDVDRAAIVDSKGRSINKNALIALISSIVLEENPNTYIITDSITSEGLTKFIEDIGGKHHRFKRGYKNVINEAINFNEKGKECHLAIETSGHAALKENYFLDDGAYLISKILIKLSRLMMNGNSIEKLIESLESAKEEREYRLSIEEYDYKSYSVKVLNDLIEYVNNIDSWSIVKPNYEGVRINCSDENENGWFLMRASLHEPLLAINIESNTVGGIDEIYKKLSFFLKEYRVSI